MTDLTPKQITFVSEYIANGGDGASAALAAGYTADNEYHRLLKNPNLLNAIRQDLPTVMLQDAVLARGILRRLAQHSRSDFVKLEASKDLLDRAGFKPPDRHQLLVTGQLSVQFDVAMVPDGLTIEGGVENEEQNLASLPDT